jgi:sodium-dependent phosphate cotransporter
VTEPAAPPVAARPAQVWLRLALVLALLYLFLVGVKGLESGIKAFGADFADRLFETVSSPLAGLFAGILATVLVQSSSVTTSTIVGLVGSGALTVTAAVPMIMGANIGTTVTNTLASLGHVRRGAEFRRAFAGATVHDFFNLLSVAVLLPLELATGFLSTAARGLTELLSGQTNLAGVAPEGSFIKDAIKLPVGWYESGVEAISDSETVLGIALLVAGLGLIFLALAMITRNMRMVMQGRIERSLNAVLAKGAGIGAMLLGVVITVAVQSSSITTSVLIPLVAAGVLTLENAYPVTLGANVGTTVTALLASVAADRPEALTIALVHTLFNITGILIFYPVPALRHVPIRLATGLAKVAAEKKRLVVAYVVGMFVVLPIVGIAVF